ncbi:hypothetical protein KC19_7G103500 [Ceratodon purpureus]|uniref:Uncharacterized protein n=1 Tax=Ceratodon purpureus TaxID=3225 RepID=A0A8T0H879_CERPU|nr:hypothetical protein KC19_7G103500 [Ceratodon purpureus]
MNWLRDATHPKAEEQCYGIVEIRCRRLAPGRGMGSGTWSFMGHMISSWQCGKLEDLPSHCVVVEPFSTGAHLRLEWHGMIQKKGEVLQHKYLIPHLQKF